MKLRADYTSKVLVEFFNFTNLGNDDIVMNKTLKIVIYFWEHIIKYINELDYEEDNFFP